jgi:integrase
MFSWALSRGYITRNAIAGYEKLEEQEWAGPIPTEEAINAVFENWIRVFFRSAAGYPWLRVRDLRPAFATEASEYGVPTKFISSGLGHSSERVTEKFYIKSVPEFAARQLLRAIEEGRNQRELRQKSDIKTGTNGN